MDGSDVGVLVGVSVYPIVYGVKASFHHYRYGRDVGANGFTNYHNVFHDSIFWQAIGTTAKYVALCVSIETLLGLGLALLVARELRFAGPIRVGLILPMTIAPVVVGVIWRLIYASDIGIVNPLFDSIHLAAAASLGDDLAAVVSYDDRLLAAATSLGLPIATPS